MPRQPATAPAPFDSGLWPNTGPGTRGHRGIEMGNGNLRTVLVALTCLTTGLLSAQAPADLGAKRTALTEATQQLRATQTEVVIGALERIAALTDDRVEADQLGIVPVLARALGSGDTEVLTACVTALAKTPNRSAGI